MMLFNEIRILTALKHIINRKDIILVFFITRYRKLTLVELINTKIRFFAKNYVFANSPGDLGSIPGQVIPKTFKMLLENSLLNTQQYKVFITGKVEQFRERSTALSYTSV